MKLLRKIFTPLYLCHRWLGLFLAIHLILLLATGVLLVFRDEIQGATEPGHAAGMSAETAGAVSYQALVDKARLAFPKDRPVALNRDDSDERLVTVRMGLDGSDKFSGSRRVIFDVMTGEMLEKKADTGFWDFVLRLHREFLLGFYGKLYVGLIGFLFFLSLASGLFLYGPMSARLSFGWLRRGRKAWTLSDLHKFIGGASFAWLVLMALTGVLLALSGQLLKVYQYTELKELGRIYGAASPIGEAVSLDQAEKSVRQIRPDGAISFITFPGTEFSTPRHYIFVVNGTEAWNKYLSELVLIDAATGELAELRGLPWYLKAAVLSEPLHFGNYGGLLLKSVWSIMGLAGLGLSITGPWLYLARKRKEARKQRTFAPATARPRSPYSLPLVFILVSTAASIGAVFIDGWLDALASLLILAPLLYLILKIVKALRLQAGQRIEDTP